MLCKKLTHENIVLPFTWLTEAKTFSCFKVNSLSFQFLFPTKFPISQASHNPGSFLLAPWTYQQSFVTAFLRTFAGVFLVILQHFRYPLCVLPTHRGCFSWLPYNHLGGDTTCVFAVFWRMLLWAEHLLKYSHTLFVWKPTPKEWPLTSRLSWNHP